MKMEVKALAQLSSHDRRYATAPSCHNPRPTSSNRSSVHAVNRSRHGSHQRTPAAHVADLDFRCRGNNLFANLSSDESRRLPQWRIDYLHQQPRVLAANTLQQPAQRSTLHRDAVAAEPKISTQRCDSD